jgi:hypothetical protein
MARPADVSEADLRALLVAAEEALDARDYNRSVRCSMDAYSLLIERRPEVIVHPRDITGAAPSFDRVLARIGPRPWPDVCGVDLVWEDQQKPYLRPAKDRFTFSDAVTVMEYTLDTAIRAQRSQAATSSK